MKVEIPDFGQYILPLNNKSFPRWHKIAYIFLAIILVAIASGVIPL